LTLRGYFNSKKNNDSRVWNSNKYIYSQKNIYNFVNLIWIYTNYRNNYIIYIFNLEQIFDTKLKKNYFHKLNNVFLNSYNTIFNKINFK